MTTIIYVFLSAVLAASMVVSVQAHLKMAKRVREEGSNFGEHLFRTLVADAILLLVFGAALIYAVAGAALAGTSVMPHLAWLFVYLALSCGSFLFLREEGKL